MNLRRTAAIALVALGPLGLAACGSTGSTTGTTTTSSTSAAAAATSESSAMSSESSAMSSPSSAMDSATADAMAKPFGPACAAVPATGAGSFSGMATDPVATAASNNPVLSTLVAAVTAAGLGDTLNSADGITVFAPTDDAFAKIPKADLDAVLADKATLTKILTNHVVSGRLAPDQLAGEHTTLAGTTLDVMGSGESFTVGKEKAMVVCGNVQTANATVYIVDTVLMP